MAGEEWRGKELRPHGRVNTYSPYLTLIQLQVPWGQDCGEVIPVSQGLTLESL